MSRETEQNYRGLFDGVICVIVDEISMLGSVIGGLHVVMCGELRELPPVNATPIFKCIRDMLGGPVLWQSMYSYPLLQVMRQSDSTFSAILTTIGTGLPLDVGETEVIQSLFSTREWCDENVRDAIRLFYDNRSVEEYNTTAMLEP
jgi:hypothetical protein